MATKPTPGGSGGTYGTELNVFLNESLASDGKIKTEALQTDATAPVADAALANKKYVDDNVGSEKASFYGTVSGTTLTSLVTNNCTVARTSEGVFLVTIGTDFDSANYVVSCTGSKSEVGALPVTPFITTKTAGSFQIGYLVPDGSNVDPDNVNFSVFGILI